MSITMATDYLTLDRLTCEFLKEHPEAHPSEITILEFLTWAFKKVKEEKGGDALAQQIESET